MANIPNPGGEPISPPIPNESPAPGPDIVPTPEPDGPVSPPTPDEAPVRDPDVTPNPNPGSDPSIDEPGRTQPPIEEPRPM